ncbi:hypothetical protein TrVE_jg11126 [Triparma verrucosa]|uniref:Enhancer of mRNA-decapping protein 4 C-terminal domain-containing protein n=1 Tax=Triparma verrucosa TaxID=1606542 RepID=A0A9W6ZBF7_9STRA|nr:hypothetical protein TrVE_jg11126 [Triparma verrucosa]
MAFSFQNLLAGNIATAPAPAPAPSPAPSPTPAPASSTTTATAASTPSSNDAGFLIPRVDEHSISVMDSKRQVNTVPITHYKTEFKERNGSLVVCNTRYILYGIKAGLLRCICRTSASRTLLRGHTDLVHDLSFFSFSSDVLGSVGGKEVLVWRVFEEDLQEPDPETNSMKKISYEKLLQLNVEATKISWHPFDPNKFVLACGGVAVVVETTGIETEKGEEGHAMYNGGIDNLGIKMPHGATVNDVRFTTKALHAVTAGDDGFCKLWGLSGNVGGNATALRSFGTGDIPVNKCLFIGEEADNVVTCDKDNTRIRVWSSPVSGDSILKQSLTFERDGASWFDACIDDTGEFLSVCDCKNPVMYVVHLNQNKDEDYPIDYVTPFKNLNPVLSMSGVNVPLEVTDDHHDADAVGEEKGYEINLYAVQTKAIQIMKIRPGVCFQDDWVSQRAEVEREDDDVQDPIPFVPPPAPASIPVAPASIPVAPASIPVAPATLPLSTGIEPPSVDPFSNWLGTLVGGAAPPEAVPVAEKLLEKQPEVTTSSPPPPPPPEESGDLLSPTALLAKIGAPPPSFESQNDVASSRQPENSQAQKAPAPKAVVRGGRPPKEKKEKEEKKVAAPATAAVTVAIPGASSQDLEKLTKSLHQNLSKDLKEALQGMLKEEMQKVGKAVTRSVKEDGEKTRKEAVAKLVESVKSPITQAFKNTMEKQIIPAYQAGAQEMMSELNVHVARGMEKARVEAEKRDSANVSKMDVKVNELITQHKKTEDNLRSENEELKRHIVVLTKSVQQLSTKVNVLANAVKSGAIGGSQGSAAAAQRGRDKAADEEEKQAEIDAKAQAREQEKMDEAKKLIFSFASNKEYEKAFMSALGASKIELTVYCCSVMTISDIFHSATGCAVSQTVLLCLLQQLGSSIANSKGNSFKLEIDWLQETALTVDPTNSTISNHLPQVKAQLIRHIKAGAESIQNDPALISEKRKLMGLLSIVSTIECD